jgi:hypothetical protein
MPFACWFTMIFRPVHDHDMISAAVSMYDQDYLSVVASSRCSEHNPAQGPIRNQDRWMKLSPHTSVTIRLQAGHSRIFGAGPNDNHWIISGEDINSSLVIVLFSSAVARVDRLDIL